jgi:hypothetical protein
MGYTLIRKSDGLINKSTDVCWISFDENGRFKEKFDEPEVGRSLLMSPFNAFYTWQTTPVTEIINKTEFITNFKTKNSEYELIKE